MNQDVKGQFSYTVENKQFNSDKQCLTAEEIINLAKKENIPAAQDDVKKLTLKGTDNIYYGSDQVDLSKEKRFSIGVKIYEFNVNGETFQSQLEKLIALDIIKRAQEKGIPIPDGIENTLLESVGDNQRSFQNDEWVDLIQFTKFILVPSSSTPVA